MEIDTSVEDRTYDLTDITRNKPIGVTAHTWSPLNEMGFTNKWSFLERGRYDHLREAWGDGDGT